ncbi:MAG: hypothetical protein H6737_14400 [Alphaproteobacteria bacterium]|nr:hypothetical protein [Alphaproteobacteria bacterium]
MSILMLLAFGCGPADERPLLTGRGFVVNATGAPAAIDAQAASMPCEYLELPGLARLPSVGLMVPEVEDLLPGTAATPFEDLPDDGCAAAIVAVYQSQVLVGYYPMLVDGRLGPIEIRVPPDTVPPNSVVFSGPPDAVVGEIAFPIEAEAYPSCDTHAPTGYLTSVAGEVIAAVLTDAGCTNFTLVDADTSDWDQLLCGLDFPFAVGDWIEVDSSGGAVRLHRPADGLEVLYDGTGAQRPSWLDLQPGDELVDPVCLMDRVDRVVGTTDALLDGAPLAFDTAVQVVGPDRTWMLTVSGAGRDPGGGATRLEYRLEPAP